MKVFRIFVTVAVIAAFSLFAANSYHVLAQTGGPNSAAGTATAGSGNDGYDPEKILDATRVGPNNDQYKKPDDAIKKFLNGSLAIITLLVVGILIYAGVMFATAAGDDGKIQKAQKTATYAIVGLIIAFLAGLIVRFILNNILGVKK